MFIFQCTFIVHYHLKNGGVAQLARAPALQAGGQEFDSPYLHQKLPFGSFNLQIKYCLLILITFVNSHIEKYIVIRKISNFLQKIGKLGIQIEYKFCFYYV